MRALLDVILLALDIYWWIIIASAIFSWLYAFGVVNPRNQVVATIGRMLYQLTEPVLRPLRRYVPSLRRPRHHADDPAPDHLPRSSA